jgi:hypothetical protein
MRFRVKCLRRRPRWLTRLRQRGSAGPGVNGVSALRDQFLPGLGAGKHLEDRIDDARRGCDEVGGRLALRVEHSLGVSNALSTGAAKFSELQTARATMSLDGFDHVSTALPPSWCCAAAAPPVGDDRAYEDSSFVGRVV